MEKTNRINKVLRVESMSPAPAKPMYGSKRRNVPADYAFKYFQQIRTKRQNMPYKYGTQAM